MKDQQIIIVTRDRTFRDALRRTCTDQGCHVESAGSVADARELSTRMPVCVVISDNTLHSPDDGLQLARDIRGDHPDVTCFLIADHDNGEHEDAMKDEAWMRIVRKPIRMLRFSADIVDVVAKSTL